MSKAIAQRRAKYLCAGISLVLAFSGAVFSVGCGGSGDESDSLAISADSPIGTISSTHRVTSGIETSSGKTYRSSTNDIGTISVLTTGVLNLSNSTVSVSGNSSSPKDSSQNGIDSAVLAGEGGSATLTHDVVSTSGVGATGLFSTGSASAITMAGGSVSTFGTYSCATTANYTGAITLNDVALSTAAADSTVIVVGVGGGMVSMIGGSAKATAAEPGSHSSAISTAGVTEVSNATVSSAGDNGAVIDAGGTLNLSDSNLSGALNGVFIHPANNSSDTATFQLVGGSLNAGGGDAIKLVGGKANLSLRGGSTISCKTGLLVDCQSSSSATLVAVGETISGNLVADSSSSLTASITGASTYSGLVTNTSLSLDATSKWKVTGNSALTTLSDSAAISGSSIANIVGNGFTVFYRKGLSGNAYLAGKTYDLAGGGTLEPRN